MLWERSGEALRGKAGLPRDQKTTPNIGLRGEEGRNGLTQRSRSWNPQSALSTDMDEHILLMVLGLPLLLQHQKLMLPEELLKAEGFLASSHLLHVKVTIGRA